MYLCSIQDTTPPPLKAVHVDTRTRALLSLVHSLTHSR